jgi:hypothetical protein
LVGAQAIYQYTGPAKVSVAELTTDTDLVLDPAALSESPEIQAAMQSRGFTRDPQQLGVWWSHQDRIEVDLMVPAAVAGPGRRAARLPGHGEMAARRAEGLEAALVDKQLRTITALDSTDDRSFQVLVAGPTALLIAKLYKVWERRDKPSRLDTKDASDVYRLLQAVPTDEFVKGFQTLVADSLSGKVTSNSLTYFADLFASPDALGSRLAAEDLVPLEDYDQVTASCADLANQILLALQPSAEPD